MALNFTLTPNEDSEPATLASVDEALCAHFGADVDPKLYYQGWYDVVGLMFALGYRGERLRKELRDSWYRTDDDYDKRRLRIMTDVADFIEERYVVDSFATVGK